MPASPSSSVQQARQALAQRLREIRLDAGLTGRALATAAGWHESKSSRIENGKTAPADDDIRAWCAICHAEDQVADLIASSRAAESMYVEWRRLERNGMRRVQEAALPLYERTRQFRIYEPGAIPGLFQTPEYAKARMARIAEFSEVRDDIDAAVAARMARQEVVGMGERTFAVVIEEWALRARLGDTSMMVGQLAHLITAVGWPSVAFGVVPMNIDRSMWPTSGFWIFDDHQVSIELPSAKITVTQPGEIAVYIKAFERLVEMAVYGARARSLITAAIDALP